MSLKEIKPTGYVKYVWSIKYCPCPGTIHYSDQFKIDGLENVAFSIGLQLDSKSIQHQTWWVKKSSSEPARATIEISIGSIKREVDVDGWTEVCNVLKDYNLIQDSLRRQVYDSYYGQIVYYDITFTCKIFWKDVIIRKGSFENTLYDEMKKFCNSEELSDVTIIVDNVKIPVHKLILSAHSPVFSTMLQSDMKEAKEGIITIKDLDSKIILEMLNYCYKGETKASDDTEIALKLLEVADIYQIAKLKEICVTTLLKNMSVENALRIVDAADDYDAVELRKTAIKFIVSYKKKIFASDEFKQLFYAKHDLMFELMCAVGDK